MYRYSRERPPTPDDARRCPRCITLLADYNPGPLCAIHTPPGSGGVVMCTVNGWERVYLRGRRGEALERDVADDLQELMG